MPEFPILAYNYLNARDESVVATLMKGRPYQHGESVVNVAPVSSSNAFNAQAYNRIALFDGDMYVHNSLGVYRFNRAGTDEGAWTQVDTASKGTAFDSTGPIYSVIAGGVPTIFYIYKSSLNQWAARWSIDGTTWSSASTASGAGISNRATNSILYQDSLFIRTPSTAGVMEFNFVSKTWNDFVAADFPGITFSTSSLTGCFFISGGTLYYCQYQSTSSTTSLFRIWSFNGSSWDTVATTDFGVLNSGFSQNSNGQTAFVYEDKTYIIGAGEVTGAVQAQFCLEVDLAPTDPVFTEIGATVFRPQMRGWGTFQSTMWWGHIVDNITDPQNPTIYVYKIQSSVRFNSGRTMSSVSFYLWNGPDAEMTYLYDVDSGWAFPYGSDTIGGNAIVTDELRSIEFTDDLSYVDANTMEFRFQVKGGSSTGISIQLLYDVNEEQPTTVATLTGTPTGGSITRNVNTLEDIDASEVNEYVARWDVGTDGVSGGDQLSLKLQVV